MEIWLVAIDRDMIKVDKLVHLYRLKESKEYGYYELVPWLWEARIVRDLSSSFQYWKSRFFFVSGDNLRPFLVKCGETSLGCSVGREPQV